MLEAYEKIAQTKRNTAEHKRDKALEDEWLIKNRPIICNTTQNYPMSESLPEVHDDTM